MRAYVIGNYRSQSLKEVQSMDVRAVMQQAESLYPCSNPTGWMRSREQGKKPFDRWTQYEIRFMMLERTGIVIDCFQTMPSAEEFDVLKND